MPAILFRERFVGPIRAGVKRQTIRARRYEPGTTLHLRRWAGKPYRSPQEDIIPPVTVEAVFGVAIELEISLENPLRISVFDRSLSPLRAEAFARDDGFASMAAMAEYYRERGIREFQGWVMTWGTGILD